MQQIARIIDAVTEFVGFYSAYLILPLIGIVSYEVFMRYAIGAPTSWAFEMTVFVYGVHYMLALSYAHKHDGHVAIDVFQARLPEKSRRYVNIIANLVMFLPTIGLLTVWSFIYAASSWGMGERASSSWGPIIYPYKMIMAVGFLLFFLQGVAKLINDFRSLRN
ncbi:TRAP transporter small permease subunit [Desulfopila inferna]|uniref:TRAP transporter small permease subunit n=1 Tax=Desulfopila inferna TaxID=468528 RepID=UPI00196343B9|nr:TRAP transporter small permease subunit [Desulfopila inferna]MBM9603315.1 TRAP transporter small permease subunit [Desulfopila inferna]